MPPDQLGPGRLDSIGVRVPRPSLVQWWPCRSLRDYNNGALDAASAAARLDVSRIRLYELRTFWFKDKFAYPPGASDGDHGEAWPEEIIGFLQCIIDRIHKRKNDHEAESGRSNRCIPTRWRTG